MGRLASLASLGSLGARFHCEVRRLRGCICVCVRVGGTPREPRFARLARRPLSLIVEFICVFMLVFMFVSAVGRLASLASLTSLGAHFHCGVHICFRDCGYVCVRGGAPREPRFARLARRPLSQWQEKKKERNNETKIKKSTKTF